MSDTSHGLEDREYRSAAESSLIGVLHSETSVDTGETYYNRIIANSLEGIQRNLPGFENLAGRHPYALRAGVGFFDDPCAWLATAYGISPPRGFGRGVAPPISYVSGSFWRLCRQNEPETYFFARAGGPPRPHLWVMHRLDAPALLAGAYHCPQLYCIGRTGSFLPSTATGGA